MLQLHSLTLGAGGRREPSFTRHIFVIKAQLNILYQHSQNGNFYSKVLDTILYFNLKTILPISDEKYNHLLIELLYERRSSSVLPTLSPSHLVRDFFIILLNFFSFYKKISSASDPSCSFVPRLLYCTAQLLLYFLLDRNKARERESVHCTVLCTVQ